MNLSSIRFVAISFLTFSILAEAKVKKNKVETEVTLTTVQQALKSIEVDPKLQVKHDSSPQSTGVLVLKAPPLNDDLNPSHYPVGVHFDYIDFSGTMMSQNNYQYHLQDFSSSVIPSLRFGKVPYTPVYFDEYALQLGYFRRPLTYNGDSSLTVAHASMKFSAENIFYRRSNWNFKYSLELGFLQSQISSSENALSNIQRKTGTAGVGLHSQVRLKESILADVGVVYKKGFANAKDYIVEPISMGAGISYLW